MTHFLSRSAYWLCAVALVLHGASLSATTVKPTDFERLVDQAELIFAGKVIGVRSEWAAGGDRPIIVTKVTFEVLEVQKGAAGSELELQFLGGTVGDTRLEVAGVPRFQIGEKAVLFVEKNGRSFCPLVGIHHGKLSIQSDPRTGQEKLWRHNGQPLTDTAEIGKESSPHAPDGSGVRPAQTTPAAGALTLEQLKQRIAARLVQSGAR